MFLRVRVLCIYLVVFLCIMHAIVYECMSVSMFVCAEVSRLKYVFRA